MGELYFRDLFSEHAAEYARFRPTYPQELFRYLATLPVGRSLAWDCGTGNGQAAIPLAHEFEHVIATDASKEQIAHATPHPKVEYRVAPAEASGLPSGTVDLVCCAQSVHWLNLTAFFDEVRRVTQPGAALALITYALPRVSERIDAFLGAYANRIVGAFWPPERTHIESGYSTLPFPFDEVIAPPFEMRADWTAHEMLAYLGTWSATRAYAKMMETDPRAIVKDDITSRWGPGRRAVKWPLSLRVGLIG
jgi:ubiquinone/menaquinone biosynthesis C-methylase UbiE